MTFDQLWEAAQNKPPEDVRELFHKLWSKAVDAPDYDKDEWALLQAALWNLAGWTQPSDVSEPAPWRNGNGLH